MPTPPAAAAARNGFPASPDAVDAAAQVNQILGTHGITPVYRGKQILNAYDDAVGTPQSYFVWNQSHTLLSEDFDQPFTMPAGQTAIGRIELALLPVGAAADLRVTLYPDNGSGAPNTSSPLASTVLPAAWLTNLAAPEGLDSAGPLAGARSNALLGGAVTGRSWSQPAVGPSGAAVYASVVGSGNYVILLGGSNGTGSLVGQPNVATIEYLGSGTLSGPIPQPPLPVGAYYGMAAATGSTLMFAGGITNGTYFSTVWTASWNPDTGSVGAWSAQAPLPLTGNAGLIQAGAASWGDTVYIVGGSVSGQASDATANVWYASAVNGQISSWNAAPPLPQPLQVMFAGVVGNWLVVTGGQTTTGANNGVTYFAPINTDGSLGGWQTGPTLPVPGYALSAGWCSTTTDNAFIVWGALLNGTTSTETYQSLTFGPEGPGTWQTQMLYGRTVQVVAFEAGNPGTWDLIGLGGSYYVATLVPVPMMSIPLPASGLTPGASYHVLVHQIGGDVNDYVQVGELEVTADSWQYAPRGSNGPWTAHPGFHLMMNVYDQSVSGPLLHTWGDPGNGGLASEVATYVRDAEGRLLGECAATAFVTQVGEEPAYLPSVAALVYPDDGGVPTAITALA